MSEQSNPFHYVIKRLTFDAHYQPAQGTRLTTNFANLARGDNREQNLQNALQMINQRFNDLAFWDNPTGDRYRVALEIVSAQIVIDGEQTAFPAIEMLNTQIIDQQTQQCFDGIVGNSFSSYVRDYDFSVLLAKYNQGKDSFSIPPLYGELHGKLFQALLASDVYQQQFNKAPVFCLSVSQTRTYQQSPNHHPILGVEYTQPDSSLTDAHFAKMGLAVRYFMPPKSVAPFAFYFQGDLLNDYSNLELISCLSTMETFQKIYRPEIYNANAVAGQVYQPSLQQQNYSLTTIDYDRDERTQLAIQQGKFTETNFIKPHDKLLQRWLAQVSNPKAQTPKPPIIPTQVA